MTHTEIVRKTLKKAGKPLTVKQIANLSGLKSTQIRSVISPAWLKPFVNVGSQQYDLAERALKGAKYRYAPTKDELKLGVLQAVDEIEVVLDCGKSGLNVNLIDKSGKRYALKRRQAAKTKPFPHYQGIKPFYSKSKITLGDNIIFTLLDYRQKLFRIELIKQFERNEQAISVSNQKLADFVYDILKYNQQRYEQVFFFYSRVMPFLKQLNTPPDHLEKALAEDARFKVWRYSLEALSKKDKTPPKWGDLDVGMSKYLFESRRHPNVWCWAVIENDQYGRYGFCARCGIPLQWFRVLGWVHPEADPMEYEVDRDEVELDPKFLSIE